MGWVRDRFDYWVRDPVLGAMSVASHEALWRLSIDACSEIGARRGMDLHRIVGRYRMPADDRAARANWARLRPGGAAPDQVEAAMTRLWQGVCRTLAELSVLERLWPQGRIEVIGAEHLAAAWASGKPLLVAGLHLGSWEAVGPAMVGLDCPVADVYQPPPNRFEHAIVAAARRRAGMQMVAPGPGAAPAIHRTLTGRRAAVLIFLDEFQLGRVNAPAFGRPPPGGGNIVTVARLAAMTGAAVIPAYAERLGGARLRVNFLAPAPLVFTGEAKADVAANVGVLDSIITPVVLKHLDQWLMLPDFRFDR